MMKGLLSFYTLLVYSHSSYLPDHRVIHEQASIIGGIENVRSSP
jgi:hypothetical protein